MITIDFVELEKTETELVKAVEVLLDCANDDWPEWEKARQSISKALDNYKKCRAENQIAFNQLVEKGKENT